MEYTVIYTALGFIVLIMIIKTLYNNLSTSRYNSIGEYLRKEGIPPCPKELRFKRPIKKIEEK